MLLRRRHLSRVAVVRGVGIVGFLAAVLIAPAAFANLLVQLSFDRQVVAADVFVIGVGVGDRSACPGSPAFIGDCTTVRVLQSLKGEVPSELSLSRKLMGISETNVDCCEADQVYAMALRRNLARPGVYDSTNGAFAIYRIAALWPRSNGQGVAQGDSSSRTLSFDQQVVASDAFVIAISVGDRHQCRDVIIETECTTFTLVRPMKGDVSAAFELPVSTTIYDLETRTSKILQYGFDEAGEIYAMALQGSGDRLRPLGPNTIHRLSGP